MALLLEQTYSQITTQMVDVVVFVDALEEDNIKINLSINLSILADFYI